MLDINDNKPAEILPVKEGVIAVDEWKPNKEDYIMTYSGKTIIIPFDKLIRGVKTKARNTFYVSYKDSYVKKFDLISHYINYFIKFYDDGELILNYLYLKYFIDAKENKPERESFIKYLYETFVTPSMYSKIVRFVDDNYRIDLAQNKDDNKQYSESLEFTNRHAKLLILISTFIKMMIPIISHYISTIKGKSESKNLILYYKPLFEVVERIEHVDLYAKLFNSINVKVNFNESKNRIIWAKYEANSIDTVSYTEELLDKNLIVDNIFKYVFTKSIISFNSVILKTQLQYRCIKNFGITMREISTEKDSEGLSYLDKLEMNAVKIDENLILLSKVNIDTTIKRMKKRLRIKIPKEEIEFYNKFSRINKINKSLVFYYYAKYFGGFNDLLHINQKQYMKLMVLMKKRLEILGYKYIPIIISANVEGRISNRLLHNSKFMDEVVSSDIYHNLIENKFNSIISTDKKNVLINLLAVLINTQFSYCEFDNPEILGENITLDNDILWKEYIEFVNQI